MVKFSKETPLSLESADNEPANPFGDDMGVIVIDPHWEDENEDDYRDWNKDWGYDWVDGFNDLDLKKIWTDPSELQPKPPEPSKPPKSYIGHVGMGFFGEPVE